ncbi:MAG: restriction endonuclease [Candidatus Limnocylindrales bacterium]|jgi:restriction system protein
MARRSGLYAAWAQASREKERQRQAQERAQAHAIKAREQAVRAAERSRAANERDAKRLHTEAREEETAALEAELASRIESLENILKATLAVDDYIDLDTLKQHPAIPPFAPGLLGQPIPRPQAGAYAVLEPTFAQRLIPGAKERHARAIAEAQMRLQRDNSAWEANEAARNAQLQAARGAYDREVAEITSKTAAQHAEIDAMKADLDRNDAESIRGYFEMVLSGSAWPDGFPQRFALAHDPQSKLLAIDYQLPDFSIVPTEKSYRYIKARDAIEPVAEAAAKRRTLYASAIAQSAIRIVHEVFEADRRAQIETIVLNGIVDTVDRATGQRQKPCIVSLRTTAATFGNIKLDAVDPAACLKGLSAAVSPSPADLAPVRPVLDLKMVDPRFITETDVLSQLDQRPNLMELSPGEFEALITNLFTKMGLETRLTQASRDGGVDCVAFDPRPIFGGKVVIQAKRYKNTVGVSAVRDLFGTMQNEGASKGILVTTSGYGSASFQFAQGKPLELLSGANLLYLLAEHAHINARIVVPEQWRDPVADSADEPEVSR